MYRSIVPLAIVLLTLLAGCGRDDRSSNTRAAADSIAQPDSEFSGAKIYVYDGSHVTAEILADKIVEFGSKDSTMAYGLDINSYDTLGNINSHVVGDSGIIRKNNGYFTIFGNVVVDTQDSMTLETDYLNWNSSDDRIYTDAFVRITTPQETVRGWGMEADQRLKRYKILHQVSGELENTKKLRED